MKFVVFVLKFLMLYFRGPFQILHRDFWHFFLMIALISQPVAMAITGPLADKFLIPGMMEGGSLAPIFVWLVGVGPGTGISLLWLFLGVIGFVCGLGGYLFKEVRDVENILPDHDAVEVPAD